MSKTSEHNARVLVCPRCRGAGMIIIKGEFKNSVEDCPECQGGEIVDERFKITKGIPVPKDAIKLYKRRKFNRMMKFPWRDMEVGDFWEAELNGINQRKSAVTSLRRFQNANPEYSFSYRLTNERETGKKGIEVWRVDPEQDEEEEQ